MRVPGRLAVALLLASALVGLQPARAADDPYTNYQWALNQIHAPTAWSVSTGSDIKIGIVDSGVNRNHEDLVGKVVAAATCVGTDGDARQCAAGGDDINGHGTHVSGIAAANTGNGKGVAGVAPNAKLVVARVFSPDPDGGEPTADLKDVEAGIEWVVGQGAQIVNLSVGVETSGICLLCGSGTESPLGPAVQRAWDRGALPILASGNNNQQLFGGGPGYSNLDAIVVGAVGRNDSVAAYSSDIGNAKWGLVAPGGDIVASTDPRCTDSSRTDCPMVLSTLAGELCQSATQPDCYGYLAGTSMAAPHVSATAALLMAKGLTRQETVDTILATTDPIDCGTNCAGRLNAARALGTVANDATNTGGNNNNGNTNRTTTTRRPSTGAGTTVKGSTTTTPTTSPFALGEFDQPSTTLRRPPRRAIVLNTEPRNDGGIPVGVGFVGIVSLAVAALAMSYNLRKTLTTLP